MLESLESSSALAPSSDGWYHVWNTGNSTLFSSIIGLPIQGHNAHRTLTFSLQTSYMYADCSGTFYGYEFGRASTIPGCRPAIFKWQDSLNPGCFHTASRCFAVNGISLHLRHD